MQATPIAEQACSSRSSPGEWTRWRAGPRKRSPNDDRSRPCTPPARCYDRSVSCSRWVLDAVGNDLHTSGYVLGSKSFDRRAQSGIVVTVGDRM